MPEKLLKLAVIGECMLELRHVSDSSLAMSFAGDTFNMALYSARYQADTGCVINYITALGDDPYSDRMLKNWQQENINCAWVQRFAGKLPGLYLIRTDARGERQFYYYRSQSAARELFYTPNIAALGDALIDFDFIYFSGITLGIFDQYSHEQLFKLLKKARNRGAKIIFDSNYRPKLWPNKNVAATIMQQAYELTDIALPTFTDEQLLFDDVRPQQTIARMRRYGIGEMVVKMGAEGCLTADTTSELLVPGQTSVNVVDTTAAGDSFNAAYLAARIKGFTIAASAKVGNILAATVIGYPGAIIPAEVMPKLFE